MMQVGTNPSTTYHSQPSLPTSGGQPGRSSSTSRQQQQSQYDNEQLANIRPRLCTLRKWPHYDGYGVHLARNQHWLGLRIGDVEPNSPAESGGLLREDVVLAVNGHPVENDDFFVILSFIQHELEDDQIRFLVLDPHNADLARRNHLNIDENFRTCVRMETPTLTVSPEKLLYDQWRAATNADPTAAQNIIHLGPTPSLNQANTQRYQQGPPSDERDDVYTFLPYSDHAIENGKSFFDILFEQDNNPPSTQRPQAGNPIQYSSKNEFTGDNDNEIDDNKDKKIGSQIKDGVKNLVKSGYENIKSVLPTKHRDSKDKSDSIDSKRKNSSDSIDNTANVPESSSFVDQIKNKFKRSSSPTNIIEQEKQSQPYDRLWQASSQPQDTNNNVRPEPRMCSLTLRPGIDTIGISLQTDKDFGHIIKQVEPNSPADRAGIEQSDCIVSLNAIPLLNIPYEDVLNILKKSRNEPNLDFLVAKKSYLLKSRQKNAILATAQPDTSGRYKDPTLNTTGEVMPSSNITDKNTTSSVPASQALEQLYNKYNDEQKSSFDEPTNTYRPKETVSTTTTTNERYDPRSPPFDDDRFVPKQQQQGQIMQGVGPATADRSSWGVSSGKSTDDLPAPISGDSSIRSNSRNRRPDTDEAKGRSNSLEDSFKPLQIGITNPTPVQPSGNISPTFPSSTFADDGQRTSRPTSASAQQNSSPKALPSPDTAVTTAPVDTTVLPSSKQNQSIQNLQYATPIVPAQTPPTTRDYEQESIETIPSTQSDLRLGTTKAISAPSKPVISKPPMMNIYDDTDDDDLSDISERSREDDASDLGVNKNLQSISAESTHDKQDKPYSDSSRTATSGFYTPEPAPSSTHKDVFSDKNNDGKQELTTTISDANQPENVSTPAKKLIVQARRLEQSDSDDTASATDSHPAKQSGPDTFYSPDESIDDGNDTDDQQKSKSWQQGQQNGSNQVKPLDNKESQFLSKSSNQQQKQHDTDEDDESSISETSSTESQKTPMPIGKMALATLPLSELKTHGYELHNIQLMQPTETSPVGLKLTKQQDPLQYIITAVAKGTKADLAGLKVNDWLIKIEGNDIRSVEFAEVSQDIRHLLTNAGLINMVVARKKTPTSSPVTKQIDKQQTTPSSSRSESINRPQGGQNATSLLTTDITRDTPDNSQVRFIPDQSTSPSTSRSQRSPISTRETSANVPGAPLSVGLTNPISDEKGTKSPRSQSRSPTREYTVNPQQKTLVTDQPFEEYDPNEIRHVVLKEALGLDFNSFIPEGDSQVQTHFISNVQQSSMADKAGLRDGDRILTVNGVDVTNSVHEDVRRMMQSKKPLQLTVVNDPKYLELIENVKRNQTKAEGTRDRTNSPPPDYETVEQEKSGGFSDSTSRVRPPLKSSGSDSGSESNVLVPKDGSSKEDLSKYLQNLFTDNEGTVQIKHCILKKDPNYNGYGLLLRYQNGLHLIDQVEEDSPAYTAGLREDDVILYVDKKNVEQMTHDDVKILIRKLSLSNTNIDLILIKKSDIQRYKAYQERNSINWEPIFQNKLSKETIQTEPSPPPPPQQVSVSRSSNDQVNNPRTSSTSSSGKQPAPPPPTSSKKQSIPLAGTRVCTLQPSSDRTAGFALSGKSPAPFIICQIEKNSPADKAGLLINDALISINGKSVTDKTYEETVKLIKEALQQKSVELVVQDPQFQNKDRSKIDSQSSIGDQGKLSMGSNDSNNLGISDSIGDREPSREGSNAVEEYQKRRNKELSYTLRLCHLHPTNGDGTQAATFGFELSEDPDYEYPIILRVEPQSPAEGAGLQSRDILLKINERKTKGLGYDKVKKEIEKAKRDGRLEMLVVDQETFDYCKRTKKPLKEPEMKVKHIFPKSRSSASFHKLPIAAVAAAAAAAGSRDSQEQFDDSLSSYPHTAVGYRLSTPKETDSENEDDNRGNIAEKSAPTIVSSQTTTTRHAPSAVNFDLTTPSSKSANASIQSKESPLKFFDPAQTASQSTGASSLGNQNVPQIARSTPALNQTSTKGSKTKAIPNAIHSLFHKISHPKSSKPDYDAPSKTTTSSKGRAPSPPTVRVGHNRLDAPRISQSLDTVATSSNLTTAPVSSIHDTVRSTISTGSFDYLKSPRRCVLKVDRNKGLGFVLSATGDYDHTITAVEKYSAADIAGLQINDEVIEVDGVDVRNVKYEQVVEMLVSAMRTNESIEMRVVDGRSRDVYPSTIDADKQINSNSLLNSNNNNNNTITSTTQRTTAVSGDDLSDLNSSISPFDSLNHQKIATSYPNLPGQFRQFDSVTNRALSGSVPALATGITASPNIFHQPKSISTSSEKGSITKLSDISAHDAPVARLCRIRKFATSPFYGFFLCGDPKKLGRVFISDVTKHSPAAVCGLRDGDRILEINGTTIETLTYETILDKIKQHMAADDLELLVLDKKSVHWYRERNYPITSRTLPTIVHMEPILNDGTTEIQSSEVPATQTKLVGFPDRRVSKTGL